MKCIISSALVLCSFVSINSVYAESLVLKAGAPLVSGDYDCEGHPCGPYESISFSLPGNMSCSISVTTWEQFIVVNGKSTVKNNIVIDLDAEFRSDTSTWSTGRTCIEHHPYDAKLCTLERIEYGFFSSFQFGEYGGIMCSRKDSSPLAKVDLATAKSIVFDIQSQWVEVHK